MIRTGPTRRFSLSSSDVVFEPVPNFRLCARRALMKTKSILWMVLLLVSTTWAQVAQTTYSSGSPTETVVPRLVRFAGTIKDDAGKPLTGITGLTFSLYKDQEGGGALWMETQNVQLDSN